MIGTIINDRSNTIRLPIRMPSPAARAPIICCANSHT